MQIDLSILCVRKQDSIHQAIQHMDANHLGIVLVVDGDRCLIGTVTDGDVRRAILARIDLRQAVQSLLERKAETPFAQPVTASIGADRCELLEIFQKHSVSHLPLLDDEGRVVGLVSLSDFLPDKTLPVQAVVMAGGKGSRLRPLTNETPKPMLDVGGRPLLEIIIQQLREAGIHKVSITTHHHSEKIERHFEEGRDLGVDLSFITEDQPLGTVGGLKRVGAPSETILVINGDILTQVDFRAMLAYHREHQADLTVAVKSHGVRVPYGVIECDGPMVSRITEKPVMNCFINGGIYLMEPSVYDFIPEGRRFDMTDLIQRLVDKGCPVASFPIRESWMDIGQPSDYEKARGKVRAWGLTPPPASVPEGRGPFACGEDAGGGVTS